MEPTSSSRLEDDFKEPYLAWKQDPRPANADKLLQSLEPVMHSAMRTFAGTDSPTLKGHAKRIVLDALGKYDPQRAKLRTHLMVHLQGLRRLSAVEGQAINVPERVRLDQFRLHRSETDLRARLGRDPSTTELAEHSGLPLKRIGYVRRRGGAVPESQWIEAGSQDAHAAADALLSQAAPDDKAWREFVYLDAHPTDQLILEHTLGLHGKNVLPKKELAAKLGLSPSAISQRALRLQNVLNRREELAGNLF
jgi:DNA-directed RNA polymerase specialized sigma subunit